MWHVKCDTWTEFNILLRLQVPCSYSFADLCNIPTKSKYYVGETGEKAKGEFYFQSAFQDLSHWPRVS